MRLRQEGRYGIQNREDTAKGIEGKGNKEKRAVIPGFKGIERAPADVSVGVDLVASLLNIA